MNQTKAHTFIVYRCPVCHEFKSMQGSPRCHNVPHEPVEVVPLPGGLDAATERAVAEYRRYPYRASTDATAAMRAALRAALADV